MVKLTPEQIEKIFIHRRDCFATQQSNGAYYPTRREITIEDIKKHLNGDITLGAYCLNTDNTVKWACIDLDGTDLRRLKGDATILYDLFPEFSRILEESGRRGYHVWVLFNVSVPASYAQQLIKSRLNRINMLRFEIFPKQVSLSETRKYGNLVKIPLGVHKLSGKKSKILKYEGI